MSGDALRRWNGRLNSSDRISSRSTEQFDPRPWIDEGDGFIASSRKTREIWRDHRKEFCETISERKAGSRNATDDWNLLTGLPRTSMLLLGYAVEMYFKAGLVKAYLGCSTEMLERDLKSRFGHKLSELAKETAFPLNGADENNLGTLKNMILVDARYPIFMPKGRTYADAVNQRTSEIWSDDEYDALSALAHRVREHTSKIDSDSSNRSLFRSLNIDQDGYLAFRMGGRLPPRITYRLSTEMRNAQKTSEALMAEVKNLFDTDRYSQIVRYWDRASINEDGKDSNGQQKTHTHQQPTAHGSDPPWGC